MSKLLYIKANVKPTGQSRTFRISDELIEEYRRLNPQDEVITLDLYHERIDFLREDDLEIIFGPKNQDSKHHPKLKYAYQFVEADKYVIAAPMWNLSVPAILKAYIDYISVTGITFKYTESGPVGLCTGKKAIIVATRGGQYSTGITKQFEYEESYLRTILGFFGIANVESVIAENLDVIGADVDNIISGAINIAKEKVRKL